VELVPGQGGSFAAKQVGLDNAAFGLGSGAGLLQARANDLPVRSYAAAQQSTNAAVYTVAEAFGGQLEEPSQLAGTRVAVIADSVKTQAFLASMLVEAGVRDSVEFVEVGVEQQTSNLLSGNVDAAVGIFADGLGLRQRGYDASMLLVGDHVPTVGRTVFARPAFATENPETVRGFLRATARGWAWAADDPTGAEEVMIDAKPSLAESRDLGIEKIEYSADRLIATEQVAEHGWGWQSADVWASVHETLSSNGVLPAGLTVDEAWTNAYLDTDADAIARFTDRTD